MDYVSRQNKAGIKRLWPQLKNTRDGYGQAFQRKFGRLNRKDITEDRKKVFHSLRHNFSNSLKQNRAQVEIISELLGHSHGSITLERYGKRYTSENKLETLNKLDYGIDFLKILS
jgi:integrase